MNIREIHENKKQFLPLLLLADEQEDMIDRYLGRGTMYVLEVRICLLAPHPQFLRRPL